MKKWWLLLVGLVLIIMMTGCSDKNSYSMDRVETRAYVVPDGDLYVEELFTYTFKGDINGMTRYIDKADQEGSIEFFEAFVPPENPKLGSFSYEDLKRLDVKWDNDNGIYYINNDANNKMQQVYYRYRVDKAAIKYDETGKLEWSFLKNSKQEIHNVSIDLFMPENYEAGNVHAFLHDRTGGKITTVGPPAVHYENKELSANGNANMVVLFPPEHLSQMAASEGHVSLQQLLANEQKQTNRLEARDGKMQGIESVLQVLMVVYLLGAVLYALSWRRISAWMRRREVLREELDQLDPLLISYMLRKGKLKKNDFMAGLLSLSRRGLVNVKQVQASKRFLEDPTGPEITLLFTFNGQINQLDRADRYLVNWLFEEENGIWIFKFDSAAGPTFKERQVAQTVDNYRKKANKDAANFDEWKRILSETELYSTDIRMNPLLKLLIPATVILHFGLLLYLYYTDVASTLSMVLIAVLLGAGAIWTAVRYKSKLWVFLFLLACFIIGAQVVHGTAGIYLILVACSALFALAIPKQILSWKTQQLRFALKDRRRKLMKGEFSLKGESSRAELDAEHAILLGIMPQYMQRMKSADTSNAVSVEELPVVFSMDILNSLDYTQTHLGFRSSGTRSSKRGSSTGKHEGGRETGAL